MCNKSCIKWLFFILIIFQTHGSFSQDSKYLLSIIEKNNKINEKYHFQKVFVHTDKESYYTNEKLFLRAYVLNSLNKTDSFSKNLHVEILYPDNKVALKRLLKIEHGFASGDFPIPDSLGQGEYILRAYTPFMKNFNYENAFIQRFSILNFEKYFFSE